MKRILWLPLVAIFISCATTSLYDKPKLVVFISIDQMRPDLLTHFDELFTGGFRWLIDHSIWYTNVHHEHAYTSTGPGHFVLASGQHPGPIGVLGNSWYDRSLKRDVYCVEDSISKIIGYNGDPRSYRHIKTTALGDWLKSVSPESKVYAVASKDRASVFMGGKHPDLVLWYNWQGAFVTSDYYAAENPEWLKKFNEELNIAAYRDSLWTRELDPIKYEQFTRPDNFPGELDRYDTTPYSPTLPIGFDSTLSDKNILNDFGGTPWMEKIVIKLATTIVRNEHLGLDSNPDILFVGLSATDWVIHDFGPFSQETMDHLLKVDKYLNRFITELEKLVGLDNILFVLSADHGGMRTPEILTSKWDIPAGRISSEMINNAYEEINRDFNRRFGTPEIYVQEGFGIYYDLTKMADLGIDKSTVDLVIKNKFKNVEGMRTVIFKDDVLQATKNDTLLLKYKNITHPEMSPDAWFLPKKYWVLRYPYGTSHGTPYDYDSHVPLLFGTKHGKPVKINRLTATVDIAVTIARILDINPPNFVDGIPLKELY